ncbi:MAG: hypothetical protein LV479_11560 [Methylacidiphilales bacterium]|nr:hypothetical protein [Candidatus Methylacidiphilales bacterium]
MKSYAGMEVEGAYQKASRFLPKTRFFDYGLSLIRFYRTHRRLPVIPGGGLNDALFFIMTTDEILDPLRCLVSDKALVKQYVREKLGDTYNVETIAILDSFEDALHFTYPTDCVIKPTHLSGEILFRRGGSSVDFDKIRSWFSFNYYLHTREANYRDLKSRIIIEPFIFNQETVEDYKIFCLNGQPRIIQVDFDRHTRHTQNLYTTDWELLPFAMSDLGQGKPKPGNLSQLIDVAAKLSEDFNFIRIDLYTDERAILVGEITNCHQGAQGRYVPPEGEKIMARLLFGDSGFYRSILKKQSPVYHQRTNGFI